MGRTKCAESSLVLRGSGKVGRGCKDARSSHLQHSKTGFDGPSEPPTRKTVSTFNQPVTLVHTTSRRSQKAPTRQQQQMNSITKGTEGNEKGDKGRQVFWAKSLEGLRAMVPLKLADKFSAEDDVNIAQRMELPQKIEAIVPSMSVDAATTTFCSALHTFDLNGAEIIGQKATMKQIEENPLDTLIFTQPFVQIPTITDQDIMAQERRVIDARKRLQELRKSFLIR